MKRKIIQIAAVHDAAEGQIVIVALCNDGTVWVKNEREEMWYPLKPDIPQEAKREPRVAVQPRARTGRRAMRDRPIGVIDGRVLQTILSTPGVTTEQLHERLRERSALRDMRLNILGTCLTRLIKNGLITGPPKIGPFSATEAGIAIAQKDLLREVPR